MKFIKANWPWLLVGLVLIYFVLKLAAKNSGVITGGLLPGPSTADQALLYTGD
jgi:hypothetical protein